MRIKILKDNLRANQFISQENHNTYVVYAILIRKESVVFLFNLSDEFLSVINVDDVEIIDRRISRHWSFGNLSPGDPEIILGYKDLSKHENYEKLIDHDQEMRDIFRKAKIEMDLEFRDPEIVEKIENINGDWLYCNKCDEAWKPENTIDEMVQCPKCKSIYLNSLDPNIK